MNVQLTYDFLLFTILNWSVVFREISVSKIIGKFSGGLKVISLKLQDDDTGKFY